MPIKISPSRCVDIDLTHAINGEVVAVTLEDASRLFLSVWTSPPGYKYLVFDPQLFPQGLRDCIDVAIKEIWWTERSLHARREHGAPGESTVKFLERWLKDCPHIARSRSLYGQRNGDMIDVGETPYVQLPYPADRTWYQWEASAPISSIEITTKEEAMSHIILSVTT